MESIERASHPSMAQVESLVQYLEARPNLAKGFLRNPNAKAKAFREWETLALKLNSIGGGAIKSAKKWVKYWADKKSAVKKKVSAQVRARNRTGGGVEEIPELTEVEARIMALMGGGGFATGDVHVQLQVFDEPNPVLLPNSPSVLVGPSTSAASISHPIEVYADINVHEERSIPVSQSPPHPLPLQTASMVTAEPVLSEAAERLANASATTTPRRGRHRSNRRSPPSQRRSQFLRMTEKFLKLEDQRLALEHRIVAVWEQNLELNRLTTQALLDLAQENRRN